ncbi:MAG TPA: hypothetical protein VH762_07775 [Gemmatimonadaceae bacterium]|jgi:hypothetical protein
MISKRAVTGLIALIGVAFACGGREQLAPSELHGGEGAVLTVTNDYLTDVTVYAVRSGMRTRLGTVYGFRTETLPIRNTVLWGAGTLRFLILDRLSGRAHLTEPLTIGPSDAVLLTVRNPINMSSFLLRYGSVSSGG